MNYRRLGQTDISVSVVAMGCWVLAGDETWGPQSEAESTATVRAALDAGVNFFDTAEGYGAGASELVLGRALAGRRHEAVIATKASGRHLATDAIQQACEQSLRRLNTDYIDLYQVHWPSRTVPLGETLAALEDLRRQGKVRAAGVCNFGPRDLAALLSIQRPASNQLPYSLLWRAIEYEIQQRCLAAGVGILCYSPLAQGLLTGKYSSADEVPEGRARTRLFSRDRPQARHDEDGCEAEVFAAIERIRRLSAEIEASMAQVAVSWLLHQPGVTAVLAGARTPDQIQQTATAADLELSSAAVKRLSAATEAVKHALGPNPDMWQSKSRFR